MKSVWSYSIDISTDSKSEASDPENHGIWHSGGW